MSGQWSGGKGDAYRRVNQERYSLNYDLAFGTDEEKAAARKRLDEIKAAEKLQRELDTPQIDDTLEEEDDDDDLPSFYFPYGDRNAKRKDKS